MDQTRKTSTDSGPQTPLETLALWHASKTPAPGDLPAHPAWDHPHPLHTVYGGAHLFKPTTISKLGQIARKTFQDQCPGLESFLKAFQFAPPVDQDLADAPEGSQPERIFSLETLKRVQHHVQRKLAILPINDYRIDFEDGLGLRSDSAEDSFASQAALALMEAARLQELPPLIGIRIKSFSTPESTRRALRTLEIFLKTATQGDPSILPATFPATFIVTLPKVESPVQVAAFMQILKEIPARYPLEHAKIRGEIMIESPLALRDGGAILARILGEDQGLLTGIHFGAHDYLASLHAGGVHPSLRHPLCDDARAILKKALCNSPLALVDGAETFLPLGSPSRVHHAWRLSFDSTWHALSHGIYQGWDLHPAQIPARLTAVFCYFLSGLPVATARLKNFVEGLTQAARVGARFDDLATVQGLIHFFDHALRSGVVTRQELQDLGLNYDQARLQVRSHLAGP